VKLWRYFLVVALAIVGTVFGVKQWTARRHQAPAAAAQLPTYDDSAYDTRAPEGVRIKVEVLNATKSNGLARRATVYLRDRGFDVVAIGTTRLQQDKTVVLDRSNHPDWARLLAKAMRARMASRPDTSRYLDATVLIGRDWAPPAQPFYP
jgi:hypothetical protein